MQHRYAIVTVRIVGEETAYHVLRETQHATLKQHVLLQRLNDERTVHDLLEAVGKDFTTRRRAEAYVESMRGVVADRMYVTLAPRSDA